MTIIINSALMAMFGTIACPLIHHQVLLYSSILPLLHIMFMITYTIVNTATAFVVCASSSIDAINTVLYSSSVAPTVVGRVQSSRARALNHVDIAAKLQSN